MVDNAPTYISPNGTLYISGGQYANCTLPACPVELSVYGYRPTLVGSSVLIALYAIALIIQLALGLRYKTWWYMGSMIAGCADEVIGYGGRILLYQNPWNHSGFIMQIVLITIGPVFFSAALYVLLSQIIKYIEPKLSRFNPRIFSYVFIACDFVSLILQAVGGAISSSTDGDSSTGVNIALAGLAFQVITLVAFSAFVIDYVIRSRNVWRTVVSRRFTTFAVACATATMLILIRCCYRVYELNDGYQQSSSALRDQPLFEALESSMIILAAYAMIFAHPGNLFKSQSPAKTVDGEKSTVGKFGSESSSASTQV